MAMKHERRIKKAINRALGGIFKPFEIDGHRYFMERIGCSQNSYLLRDDRGYACSTFTNASCISFLSDLTPEAVMVAVDELTRTRAQALKELEERREP
jgi:hypothetical protein